MIRARELTEVFTNATEADIRFIFRYEGFTLGNTDPRFIPDQKKLQEIGYHEVTNWYPIYRNNPNEKAFLIIILIKEESPSDLGGAPKAPTRDEVINLLDIKAGLADSDLDTVFIESIDGSKSNVRSIELYPLGKTTYKDSDGEIKEGVGMCIRIYSTDDEIITNFADLEKIGKKLKEQGTQIKPPAPKSLSRAKKKDLQK